MSAVSKVNEYYQSKQSMTIAKEYIDDALRESLFRSKILRNL